MAYAYAGVGALDYLPCRYGTSKLTFRGPRTGLDRPYVAALGGTETYGRFVPEPYPALVERSLGRAVVNFGLVNAGLDVFLGDPTVMNIARGASARVVQIVGAHNLTNRFYSVHPRRNDRFLHASPLLRSIFRDVDFTEFHFTRHMLQTLQAVSSEKFEVVAEELRVVWVHKMTAVLKTLGAGTTLLWIAARPPAPASRWADLSRDPLLVDREMVCAVRPYAAAYVEIETRAAALADGLTGMAFSQLERPAAAGVPNATAHRDIAERLLPVLRTLL